MYSGKAERNNDAAGWKKATAFLQEFLKLTEEISAMLEGDLERPRELEERLAARAELIRKIQEMGLRADTDADPETQKHRWLYGQLLERIGKVEESNERRLKEIMREQMKRMRETTQSIRTIDAYNRQMREVRMPGEESGALK